MGEWYINKKTRKTDKVTKKYINKCINSKQISSTGAYVHKVSTHKIQIQ